MFLEHLTHIFGFNCEDKSFIKVFYSGDRPLFGLVNTIKHLENNFDKNIFYIYIFLNLKVYHTKTLNFNFAPSLISDHRSVKP